MNSIKEKIVRLIPTSQPIVTDNAEKFPYRRYFKLLTVIGYNLALSMFIRSIASQIISDLHPPHTLPDRTKFSSSIMSYYSYSLPLSYLIISYLGQRYKPSQAFKYLFIFSAVILVGLGFSCSKTGLQWSLMIAGLGTGSEVLISGQNAGFSAGNRGHAFIYTFLSLFPLIPFFSVMAYIGSYSLNALSTDFSLTFLFFKYPYLLSCLLVSILTLGMAFVVKHLLIDIPEVKLELENAILDGEEYFETSRLVNGTNDSNYSGIEQDNYTLKSNQLNVIEYFKVVVNDLTTFTPLARIILTKVTLLIQTNFLISILINYLFTPISKGGLGFSLKIINRYYLLFSFVIALFSMFTTPRFYLKYGPHASYSTLTITAALAIILLPFLTLFAHLQWVDFTLASFFVLIQPIITLSVAGHTYLHLIICTYNHPKLNKYAIFGLTYAISTATLMIVGPYSINMFEYFATNSYFPINPTWSLMVTLSLVNVLLAKKLPGQVDQSL